MTDRSNAAAVSHFNPKTVAATLVGLAVGAYAGLHLIVPTSFAIALMLIATKLFPENRRRYVNVFSWQAAHALWLCLALLAPAAQAVVVDIVLVSGLLTWLLMRPGYPPLYALAIYQVVSLYTNCTGLIAAEVSTATHKALLVHVLFRVLALTYIAIALFEMHRGAKRSAAQ
jgi:hypothetical protein